jgi:LysR family glycine cleavage system transcriptional activator
MVLNSDGQMLLARIAPALDALAVAIDATTGESELLAAAERAPAFRIAAIIAGLPNCGRSIPSSISTSIRSPMRWPVWARGIDAAIVLGREVDATFYSRRIAHNNIAVIGAKSLLQGEHAIRTPADITRATVLIHRDLPELFNEWRDAIGEPELEPAAFDRFDSGAVVLEAAAQGLGIALYAGGPCRAVARRAADQSDPHAGAVQLQLLVRLAADGAVESRGPHLPRLAVRRFPHRSD